MICRHCNGIVRGNTCDCPAMFARFEREIADAEVMEDMVLTCASMMTTKELAQSIREGITTIDRVEKTLTAQQGDEYRSSHDSKLLSNWMSKATH